MIFCDTPYQSMGVSLVTGMIWGIVGALIGLSIPLIILAVILSAITLEIGIHEYRGDPQYIDAKKTVTNYLDR